MVLRIQLSAPAKRAASVLSWVFIASGAVGIGAFAWFSADGWMYQELQEVHFARQSLDAQQVEGATAPASEPFSSSLVPRKWLAPDPMVLGRIEIPRLDISAIIREGVDAPALRKAVGHVAHTPPPGEWGNSVLAGHRDTFFRSLRLIRRGDHIRILLRTGTVDYAVDTLAVVEPTAVEVMRSTGERRLTLVTCFPFGYAGPAPRRFVVSALATPAAGDQSGN